MAAMLPIYTVNTIDGKERAIFDDSNWKIGPTYDEDVKAPTVDPGTDFLKDIPMVPVAPPTVEDIFDDAKTLRENKLHTLMLRLETVDILESLAQSHNKTPNSIAFLLQSNEYLHTFAQLVEEDLITLVDGELVLTDLCYRLMDAVAEL
jgi:hypothetical protein